jgi:hypothetical protein
VEEPIEIPWQELLARQASAAFWELDDHSLRGVELVPLAEAGAQPPGSWLLVIRRLIRDGWSTS